MSKRRLLWWADFGINSGFARLTHSILPYLTDKWDVSVLGILYTGDPHTVKNVRAYTAIRSDGGPSDVIGVAKISEVIAREKPHVALIIQDPWVVSDLLVACEPSGLDPARTVAYMPVDSPNAKKDVAKILSRLACAVFYTEFGRREYVKAGLRTATALIPHAVDTNMYRPIPRHVARQRAGFPSALADGFIVGSFHRNQPRKRVDLAIEYFAKWVEAYNLPENVYLYLHCASQDPAGIDITQYAEYCGIRERLYLASHVIPTQGVSDEHLALLYNACDVHICTSMGEGWNLPMMEGMATGVPQIGGDWGGQGEWAKGSALMVPCTNRWILAPQVNTIQGIPDRQAYVEALNKMYTSQQERDKWRRAGLALTSQKEFTWESVANKFHTVLSSIQG